MNKYGIIRPIAAVGTACVKAGGRVIRAVYEQRRLKVGRNVRVAYDVRFIGRGDIVLADDVTIGRGVLFNSDHGGLIEVGPNSYIGANSQLEVRSGQILRLGRGFQLGARCHIVSERGIVWADGSLLGRDSYVGPRESGSEGSLVVGTRCYFHNNTLIDLCADVTVGDNVRTGPFCAFYTHNHVRVRGKLIWDQKPVFAPITIGEETWIGHNCAILPGVSIGNNATIATGAVVTRSIKPWSVAGGIPARILKSMPLEN